MKGGQKEPECRRLHGRLDGSSAGDDLIILGSLAHVVACQPSNQVENYQRKLQHDASLQNGPCTLGHGSAHKDNSANDPNDGADRLHCTAPLGNQLVCQDTNEDWCKDNLNGGDHDAHRIYWHKGSQDNLGDERSHEDGADCGGGRHQDAQRNIPLGNVSAQVGCLSTVDGANQNASGYQCRRQSKQLCHAKPEDWHHNVAGQEVYNNRSRFVCNSFEIVHCHCDAHAEHQHGQSCCEVVRAHEAESSRLLECQHRSRHIPQRE
mmetsp:Transcript_21551/g.59905  ORF Transcript_21551/g.59905 Transcript_21551/m.59905 type:complete len:264 (-) Transcript_21551:444-1235(-)